MKKNKLATSLVAVFLFYFVMPFAFADDATDMMDQMIAQQMKAETNVASPVVAPSAPEKAIVEQPANPAKAPDVLAKEVAKQSAATSTDVGQLMVADFDSGDKPNNLGGDFGAWDKDPNDDTQGCSMSFVPDDPHGNPDGFALRLDYDVDSPTPAYNGLYMKLENANGLPFNTLSFYVRGASNRFTKQMKIELKTADHRSSFYVVSGFTSEWQEIQIPLKEFKGIKSGSALSELIMVFDDVNTAPKKGTLLIDQISFKHVNPKV